MICYNESEKALPPDQLRNLFLLAGWSDGSETPKQKSNFNIGFINSTLVVSAWDGDRLVGAVRVLSDTVFRSVIYDLIVHPDYQKKGIGSALVKRCISHYPSSEWLVQTTAQISSYYQKIGFQINRDTFLTIPCPLFTIGANLNG